MNEIIKRMQTGETPPPLCSADSYGHDIHIAIASLPKLSERALRAVKTAMYAAHQLGKLAETRGQPCPEPAELTVEEILAREG